MTNPYFRQLPSFEYVNRTPDSKIGDFTEVKNLFKRGNIRPDIFENVAFFEKYKITGDDRPDNVAFKLYNDSTLDWVVLLSNNIINVQTEWPLTQVSFDTYLKEKYGVGLNTEEEVYSKIYSDIHHWETIEIKNSQGVTIIPGGLEVPFNYGAGMKYYDFSIDQEVLITNATVPVTNYEYEEKIENAKRNIYILKPTYLNVITDDMIDIMTYKKGSSQYKTDTLKRADDIRLYS